MIGNTYIFKDQNDILSWVIVEKERLMLNIKRFGLGSYETIECNDIDVINRRKKSHDEIYIKEFIEKNIESSETPTKILLYKAKLLPSQYYPRIWRGCLGTNPFIDQYDVLNPIEIYGKDFMMSIVAMESLLKEVENLFLYIEPEIANYSSYGHKLRELLILLCTEVEANWKAVLKKNFLQINQERLNTTHYIKVSDPLMLKSYEVALKNYPHCKFKPFALWTIDKPTETLPWYDIYNKVKHDRYGTFATASFEQVLNAAAALFIMQVSQWGPTIFNIENLNRFSIFSIVAIPDIPLDEVYIGLNGDHFNSTIPFCT